MIVYGKPCGGGKSRLNEVFLDTARKAGWVVIELGGGAWGVNRTPQIIVDLCGPMGRRV